MENLMNFEFKVNPSICEFEGDLKQLYKAFQMPEGNYVVCWETKNGQSEIECTAEEISESLAKGDWIIQHEKQKM